MLSCIQFKETPGVHGVEFHEQAEPTGSAFFIIRCCKCDIYVINRNGGTLKPKCLEYLYEQGGPGFRFVLRPEFSERHHLPHIHVFGPQFGEISVSLIDLEILAPEDVPGKCPFTAIKRILKKHRLELMEEWENFSG